MKLNKTLAAAFSLALLATTACQTTENPTEVTTNPQTQTPEVITPLEIKDVPEVVQPASPLAEAQNKLQSTLQRGDAELAPTYGEFMNKVSDAATQLSAAIDSEKEKGNDVSQFEVILGELNGSLMRGDAELAPTYEEFYVRVTEINSKFKEAVGKI